MIPSNGSVQKSSNFNLRDEHFAPENSSVQSVRTEGKMLRGPAEGDSGKNIGDREAFCVDQAIDSHIRATNGPAIPCQIEVQQIAACQYSAEQAVSGLAAGGDIPDPGLLARRLDEIKSQIIQITDAYGNIPRERMLRFKLAALYIQENFLTRMLYGMSSEEEAFSKVDSLDNLLPVGNSGAARRDVLDLWWLPCNAKYFTENVLNEKLKNLSNLLNEAATNLERGLDVAATNPQLCLDVWENFKREISPEDLDVISSFDVKTEFLNEKESGFKKLLEFGKQLGRFNLVAGTGEDRKSEDNSLKQSNGAFDGAGKS